MFFYWNRQVFWSIGVDKFSSSSKLMNCSKSSFERTELLRQFFETSWTSQTVHSKWTERFEQFSWTNWTFQTIHFKWTELSKQFFSTSWTYQTVHSNWTECFEQFSWMSWTFPTLRFKWIEQLFDNLALSTNDQLTTSYYIRILLNPQVLLYKGTCKSPTSII